MRKTDCPKRDMRNRPLGTLPRRAAGPSMELCREVVDRHFHTGGFMKYTAIRSMQAVALLFPLISWAESPNAVPEPPFVSQKTREVVHMELLAYQRTGVNSYYIGFNPLKTFRSTASRDELKAEYNAGREGVRQATGEAGEGSPYGVPRHAGAPFSPFSTTSLGR